MRHAFDIADLSFRHIIPLRGMQLPARIPLAPFPEWARMVDTVSISFVGAIIALGLAVAALFVMAATAN